MRGGLEEELEEELDEELEGPEGLEGPDEEEE